MLGRMVLQAPSVIMQHRRFNTTNGPRQLNVFVDFAFFVPAKTRFKEPKVVGGK